jgi:hypothetical protein
MDFVAQAREKLDQLRRRDLKLRVFGAASHGYLLRPPLSDSDLVTAEGNFGIALPADYRVFLRELGNGGAGPFYGLFPFVGEDSEDITDCGALGDPFPHRDAWVPSPPYDEDASDEELDAFEARYFEARGSAGMLYLCHLGCAMRHFLVVNGPCIGQVWYDGSVDFAGVEPLLRDDGTRHTFASWYLDWLDASLAQLSS